VTAEYDARVYRRTPATVDQVRERKYTVDQAVPLLGVSRMAVYRLVNSRRLRAYRIGHSIRIPESALREYLGGAVVGGKS
jgi:excisionase family DNA binding protein